MYFIKNIKKIYGNTFLDYIVFFIILLIFVDISPIKIFSSYVRLYQILFLLLFVFYIKKITKKNIFSDRFFLLNFIWLISYFLAFPYIVSSKDFIVITIGQLFLLLLYLFCKSYFNSKSIIEINNYYKLFILSGIIIVFIGFIQIVLGLFNVNIGLTHINLLSLGRPTSLMKETDWYSLVCTYIGLNLLVFYLSKEYFINKKVNLILLILTIFQLFISMTRSAILSFCIAALLLILNKKFRKKVIKIVIIILTIIIVSLTIFYIFKPNLAISYINRFNPITTTKTDDGAFKTRLFSYKLSIDYFKLHPIVGNGVGGLNALTKNKDIVNKYSNGTVLNEGRGNANILLTSLFDNGIVGTCILILSIAFYIYSLLKHYKEYNNKYILAMLISYISLIIDFMFNNGYRFGFIWLAYAISNSMIESEKSINTIHK